MINILCEIIKGLFITVVGGVILAIILKTYRINVKTLTITRKIKTNVSSGELGSFSFDYSSNNGEFVIGSNDRKFTTKWTKASNTSIHAYNDATDIESIGLLKNIEDINAITNIDADFSSRVRSPKIGDVVIWKNINGFYAATKVIKIQDDSRGDTADELECQYVIFNQ